ncbi:hypothetical protein Sjap_018574 [Stephania japonica]|uniref:Uncharacterized protein n=1 Tax=Stephania japonica TaxID=461633 RepID=A0AAP0NL99_9MAGN
MFVMGHMAYLDGSDIFTNPENEKSRFHDLRGTFLQIYGFLFKNLSKTSFSFSKTFTMIFKMRY